MIVYDSHIFNKENGYMKITYDLHSFDTYAIEISYENEANSIMTSWQDEVDKIKLYCYKI